MRQWGQMRQMRHFFSSFGIRYLSAQNQSPLPKNSKSVAFCHTDTERNAGVPPYAICHLPSTAVGTRRYRIKLTHYSRLASAWRNYGRSPLCHLPSTVYRCGNSPLPHPIAPLLPFGVGVAKLRAFPLMPSAIYRLPLWELAATASNCPTAPVWRRRGQTTGVPPYAICHLPSTAVGTRRYR